MNVGARGRRGHIFRKYALTFVALVGGVLLISSVVELAFTYQDNRAALVRVQREQAASAAIRIEQFLQETARQIAATDGGTNPRQTSDELRRLLRLAPAVEDVYYLDASGREQVRSSRLAMDVLASNADYSAAPQFLEPRGGRTYFSPVFLRRESQPYMTIAVEDRVAAGLAGALLDGTPIIAAEVNLKFIWDVVSRIRIGERGHAYVVDADGRLIAHPDIALVLQNTELSTLPQVRAALDGLGRATSNSDAAAIAPGMTGGQVLTTHQRIDALGWWVFAEQPLEEAFAPVYAAILRTSAILLVGLGLSVLASLFLARRMVQPIRALQAGAARIGAGELGQRLDLRTGDELEVLAEEFNSMAARLRDSYAGLEQQVAARTEALGHALEELEDKSRQLEAASRHKSGFLATMSHELRTPLNAILGYTELMLDGIYGEVPERVRGVLVRVDKSGRHLLGLINDVLDVSKIEAGQLTLNEVDYSMGDLVQAVSTAVEPLAAEKGLRLTVEVAADMPAGRGDERRIGQVLLNLVGNAIKYTDAGEVKVTATAADGMFLLTVCDTGPGIAEHDRERIFDEFQQVSSPESPSKGGTGLGLTIARRIVDLHGGRIWIDSPPGSGSTFTVILPTGPARAMAVA